MGDVPGSIKDMSVLMPRNSHEGPTQVVSGDCREMSHMVYLGNRNHDNTNDSNAHVRYLMKH